MYKSEHGGLKTLFFDSCVVAYSLIITSFGHWISLLISNNLVVDRMPLTCVLLHLTTDI